MQAGPNSSDGNALKKVLIIAYYWPPAGGPGVQRWLKFAKYLPENGWQPTLMVPDGAAYPVLDETLVEDVPEGLDIIRVPIFEPYDAAIRLFQGKKKSERLGSLSPNKKVSFTQAAMLWCRGNLLIPDPRVLWFRSAKKAGRQALRKAEAEGQPFQALVTTGPPHSVHLIGLALKRSFQLPWLADFRDLWREMDYLDDFLPTARTKRRHAKLERSVVRAADKISSPTPGVQLSLMEADPNAKEKFTVIHNGWDPNDLDSNPAAEIANAKDAEFFHLGHFGSLFPTRNIPGLWTAIRQWNEAVPDGFKPIHLNLVGTMNDNVRSSIQTTLTPSDWTDHGYVSHGLAIQMMKGMDALLLVQNNNKTGERAIPGKAFEYLATGIPIAVVTPMPSDLGDISADWGLDATGHNDTEGCIAMIQGLFEPREEKSDVAMAYSRKALTVKMAKSLTEISTPQQS